MIKTITKYIDRTLWPDRVKQGKICNAGIWPIIAALIQALSAGGGAGAAAATTGAGAASAGGAAAGSAIGAATAGIGTAGATGTAASASLGTALGTSSAIGSLSNIIGSVVSGTPTASSVLPAVESIVGNSGLMGKIVGKIGEEGLANYAANTTWKASQEGLLKTLGKSMIEEFTPFGPLLEKGITKEGLQETGFNTAKKMVADKVSEKDSPMNIDNSFTGQSPQTEASEPAPMMKPMKALTTQEAGELLKMRQKDYNTALGAFPASYY